MFVLDVATQYRTRHGKTLPYVIFVDREILRKRSILLLGELVYHENLTGAVSSTARKGAGMEYRLVDGNYSEKAYAYCKAKQAYLTLRQIKLHQCTRKNCCSLQKLDIPYWEQRKNRKKGKKDVCD